VLEQLVFASFICVLPIASISELVVNNSHQQLVDLAVLASTETIAATVAASPPDPPIVHASAVNNCGSAGMVWDGIDALEVIEQEVQLCRELLEVEEESKWGLITLAHLLSMRVQMRRRAEAEAGAAVAGTEGGGGVNV
jgi:hypothetical protein